LFKGRYYDSLLHEVPKESGNQESQEDKDEERQTGHSGYLWEMWDEGFQNRVELKLILLKLSKLSEVGDMKIRLGTSNSMKSQPVNSNM